MAMKTCDSYHQEYHQNKTQLPGQSQSWLSQLRDSAMENFVSQGLPSRRDENWKYTNIKQLESRHYAQLLNQDLLPVCDVSNTELNNHLFSGKRDNGEYRLIFIDGQFNAKLSSSQNTPSGLILMNLAQVLCDPPEQLAMRLGKVNIEQGQPFTALNTAMMTDGVYLSAEKNCHVDVPVHCLFITTAQGRSFASYPRLFVQLAEGAQLTLIEHYVDMIRTDSSNRKRNKRAEDKTPNGHFSAAVTEIHLEAKANLSHYMLQEAVNNTHIGGMYVDQLQASQFTSHSFSLGTELARHDIQIRLKEPHAECDLNGLYFTNGQQHVDYHTQIAHLAPGCRSRQLYKGVIQEHGRAVFNGKVVIDPKAQQSDAQQLNKNLLFGEKAEVDTKPELQIYADDVKCSHGATVGQLDALALFYLQSRGISRKDAETWLTYGFVSEVLQQIKGTDLQRFICKPVLSRLGQLVGGDVTELHENGLGERWLGDN